MAKKHDNLKRLCTKLQCRYGEHDVLVMQLKRELESHESFEIQHAKWSIPYEAFIKAAFESAVEMPLSRNRLSQGAL